MGIGVCVCVAGSLISIMPKYMSVPLSASASALPGCLSVRCHPVWSAARPCQNFHLQSAGPTHRHTQTHTHTVRLRGAYDIQIRQGAIPSPKHPTQWPFSHPLSTPSISLPGTRALPACQPVPLPLTGGYTCATMCVCGGIF